MHQLSEGYRCCANCREGIGKYLAMWGGLFIFNFRVMQSMSCYLQLSKWLEEQLGLHSTPGGCIPHFSQQDTKSGKKPACI